MKASQYIFLIVLTTMCGYLSAQSDTSKLNIKHVDVVKDFEAKIQDAAMQIVKPVAPPTKTFNPDYKFTITETNVKAEPAKPQILPLAIQQDPPFIVNNGYVLGSYGIKNNINVMAGYHWSQKDRYDIGIHAGYDALNNSNHVPYQKYSQTQIAAYGNYLLKENLKLYGQVQTTFQNRYLYHTDLGVDTLYQDADLRRKLNGYNITAGIANPESTKFKINYDLKLNLHNLSVNNKKAKDNGFGLQGMAEKQFGKSSVLYMNALYDYTAYRDSLETQLSIAAFVPHFKTRIGNLLLDGGVHMLYSSDGHSSLFPEAEVAWSFSERNFMIFARVNQDYYANTFTNVAVKNPYLNTKIDSLQTTVWQEYSAGIKGKVSFLSYQAKGGFKNIQNQMFLLNNRKDLRVFDMVYDNMKTTFISGNLDFDFSKMIQFGGWLTQNFFKTDSLKAAWHLPALEANIYGVLKLIDDKFKIRGDVYLGSSVAYINKNGDQDKSGGLFDLSLLAEYAILENLHITIQGINLVNNQYQRYYGYPSAGIQARLGVKWIF
jgi:hypothetical protein